MNYQKTKSACYMGFVTHAIAVNLAPLLFACFRRTYEVKLGFLAFLTFMTFAVQILVDLCCVKIMGKLSLRTLAVASQYLCAVGLIMLAVLPDMMMPEAAFLLSALFYSVGSGMAEVVMSPLIEAIPSENQRGSSLSLLHSFYSWGHALVIIVTTLLLYALDDDLWFLIPLAWSAVPLSCAVKFSKVPVPDLAYEVQEDIDSVFIKSKGFVAFMVLMLCSGASEQIMAQWSSYYAEVALGVSKMSGDLLGPLLFAVTMALGRTVYGIIGSKIKLGKWLLIFSLFTAGCFLTAALSPFPIISLLAIGASGVGISILWPGVLSVAKTKYSGRASIFAFLAFGGDVGCALGPFMCGYVSDIFAGDHSLSIGILSGALFPIALIIGVIAINKRNK